MLTEEEAKALLVDRLSVSRETMTRLEALRDLVVAENEHQNLVSAASIPHFWARHIVDSAQLLTLLPDGQPKGPWLDLGTGAGFPGLVIALLRDDPITLVESRRKRIDFLEAAAGQLGLSDVTVFGGRLETMTPAAFSVISARAFAPLHRLLPLAHSFSTDQTLWLLPKGQKAREEVESVKRDWKGVFHVKQSLTDPDAAIIVAEQVTKRGRR